MTEHACKEPERIEEKKLFIKSMNLNDSKLIELQLLFGGESIGTRHEVWRIYGVEQEDISPENKKELNHELWCIFDEAIRKAGLAVSARLPENTALRARRKMYTHTLFTEHLGVNQFSMKEVPNQYSPDRQWLPWYEIVCRFGTFLFGDRKRVSVIDWQKTNILSNAETLFPQIDSTKGEFYIHTWDEKHDNLVLAELVKRGEQHAHVLRK
jgi:hypothetical protein